MTPELLEKLLEYIDERTMGADYDGYFIKQELREMVAPPEPIDDEGGPV